MRGLCLAVLVGCSAAPTDAITWRERWELLGVADDGAVIDASVTVGHQGVLRGQGVVRVDRWPLQGDPVRYARWTMPEVTERAADGREVVLDTDKLSVSGSEPEAWRLRVRSDEANAVVQVIGRGPTVAPVSTRGAGGAWSVGVPVASGDLQGWYESGERGGKLDGSGLVLRRGGDGRVGDTRRGAYVVSGSLALGIDEQGESRVAWAHVDGRSLDVSDARLSVEQGVVTLDFRPTEDLVATFAPTTARGATDPLAHLTPPERLAVELVAPRPARVVSAASVQVSRAGLTTEHVGVMVWADPDTPVVWPSRKPPAPAAKKRRRRSGAPQ